MKRFALLFCFVLMGLAASAQMMPDSTVQVVASWNPGDKQAYNLSKTVVKNALVSETLGDVLEFYDLVA